VVSSARKERRWHIAVMSGHSTKGRWRIGRKTNAVAIMGGCDLDLRRAEIEGPEVEITAFAFWGGVTIVVPEGFDVDLRGFSLMGGRSVRIKEVPRVPGSPTIVVRAFAVMGGVDIKSKPNRSSRQLIESVAGGMMGVFDALDGNQGPVDLKALGKELRQELRQRHSTRSSAPPPSAEVPGVPSASPPPSAPSAPPPPSSAAPPSSSAAAPQASEDEELTPPPSDATVTILFCDLVDYAGMTERLGDQGSHRLLHEHHRLVRQSIAKHNGREINVQGDGFMVAFGGVARALRCAIEIQRAMDAYIPDDGANGEVLAVHIGVHTGDAVDEGDDFLGHTVIVASRLADAAAPGEVLVSSLSEQLVQGSGEFSFSAHRDTPLKGMTRPQPSATLAWAD
jgi:class 3 adenylate cyclase